MGEPSRQGALFVFISLITFRHSSVVNEPSQLSISSSSNVCEKCTSLIEFVFDFYRAFYLNINMSKIVQSLLVCRYYDVLFSRWLF